MTTAVTKNEKVSADFFFGGIGGRPNIDLFKNGLDLCDRKEGGTHTITRLCLVLVKVVLLVEFDV